MSTVEVHLIVPDFLEIYRQTGLVAQGTYPALEAILARAVCSQSSGDSSQILFEILGLAHAADKDLPVAALTAVNLRSPEEIGNSNWLQLDPVMLKPDRDRLLLYPACRDEQSSTALLQVAELLQQHFADLFTDILPTAGGSLLVRLQAEYQITTFATPLASGRSIDAFMPQGSDALFWHSIMNEIQMLLHITDYVDSLFNALWMHGYGQLPAGNEATADITLVGDDDLSRGLAKYLGLQYQPAIDFSISADTLQNSVVVLDKAISSAIQSQSLPQWQAGLQVLDQQLQVLLQRCHEGGLQQLNLYDATGRHYCYQRSHRWYFWRRRPVIPG